MLTRMLASVVTRARASRRRSPAIRSPERPARLGSWSTAGTSGDTWRHSWGSFPASDPRVVIAVSIDEPRTIYGGVAAAPVFSEIARHAIQRLAVPAAPPVSLPPFATDLRSVDPGSGRSAWQVRRPAGTLDATVNPLPQVPLSAAADAVRRAEIRGDAGVVIREVAFDSREVPTGALFFCVPGREHRRTRLARDAIRSGAAALVVERWLDLDVPQVRVPSVREAMGPMSGVVFERAVSHPHDDRGHRDERQDDDRASCSDAVLRPRAIAPGRSAPSARRWDRPVALDGRPRKRPTSTGCSRRCATWASPPSRWRSPRTRSTRTRRRCPLRRGDVHEPVARTTSTITERWRRTSRRRRRCSPRTRRGRRRERRRRGGGGLLDAPLPLTTYGLDPAADVRAVDVEVGPGGVSFRVDGPSVRVRCAARSTSRTPRARDRRGRPWDRSGGRHRRWPPRRSGARPDGAHRRRAEIPRGGGLRAHAG